MQMNEQDRGKLIEGLSESKNLEAELNAIDFQNDPDALEKQYDITDTLITLSTGMGPLRRKMAMGGME